VLALLVGLLSLVFWYRSQSLKTTVDDAISAEIVAVWQQKLQQQQDLVAEYQTSSQQHIDALTMRLGRLQARLLRLDALGQRLTSVAEFDEGEFDFTSQPALGGPDDGVAQESYSLSALSTLLARIEENAVSREQQLSLMDELIVNRRFKRETFVAGRPIVKGWLSSYYGYRSDPFTGKRTWHAGIDFAGKAGSPIVAVAGGVVTLVKSKPGYGLMLEISHGGGLVTKYAHCKKVLVKVGDVVQKGQTIAKMGSTGRSTGPHVHFEVLKNGKTVNPIKFIERASR